MAALRSFLRQHRWLAALLLAASLCLKAFMPAGYMVASQNHILTVRICADSTGEHLTQTIVLPAKGRSGEGQSNGSGDSCPFSTLSMNATAGADFVLLSLALAFILALGFAPRPLPELGRTAYVRPPLRGPPTAA